MCAVCQTMVRPKICGQTSVVYPLISNWRKAVQNRETMV